MGLQIVKERAMMIKGHNSGRQKMTINIAFKFLKITIDRKAGSRKGVAQAKSAREETINIESRVTTINFKSKSNFCNGKI